MDALVNIIYKLLFRITAVNNSLDYSIPFIGNTVDDLTDTVSTSYTATKNGWLNIVASATGSGLSGIEVALDNGYRDMELANGSGITICFGIPMRKGQQIAINIISATKTSIKFYS